MEAFKSNLNLLSSHDIERVKTALKSDKDLLYKRVEEVSSV